MENGMDPHGFRQVKSIGSCTNFLCNSKGTDALIIELASRSTGAQVASIKPDFFTNLEIRLREGLSVEVFGVSIVG
jgi:hypothetical protein